MTLSPPIRLRPVLWFSFLLLGVVGLEAWIIRRPDFSHQPLLPAAVAFDLLTVVPVLFYVLLLRRYRLPVSTLVGAFGASVALAYYMLPPAQQHYLHWTRYSLAGLEVVSILLVLLNLRRVVQSFRAARATEAGVVEKLSAAFIAVFQRPLAPLVLEVSMLYYALLSWRATSEAPSHSRSFTNYQDSATTALFGTVALLSVAEMGAIHLLLLRWWPAATGWALLVHGYGLLFLVAHVRALYLRPTLLIEETLYLRVGFLWRLTIPLAALSDVQLINDASALQQLNLARSLLTPSNLLLTFAVPLEAVGPYGQRRTVHQVSCYLDQPTAFLAAVAS